MKIYFEKIINEERGRKFRVHCRWQAPENKLDIYSHRESGFKNPTILAITFEVKDIWSRRNMKSKIEEVRELKKSKIWSFGDSTRVCDSSRVSGATDMDMPFGYPRISIPGLAHYGGGLAQGLEDNLETKKEGSNPYSTRILVKP
jgi:hypothetical protein